MADEAHHRGDVGVTSLVVTGYRPYRPVGGAQLRNWQNINALAALGPVDVVTVGAEDTTESLPGVREWVSFSLEGRSRLDRLKTACAPLRPSVYPGIDRRYSRRVASWIRSRAAARQYDIAVIETIALAAYRGDLERAARRVVFDAHNVESTLSADLETPSEGTFTAAWQVKNWILRRRLQAAERHVVTRADMVWACSGRDASEIERLYGRRTGVTVVPNGVDVDAYRSATPPSTAWGDRPVTLLYLGVLSYTPNENAALRLIREVLPSVRARGCRARAVLVGRDAPPALVDAARQDGAVEVTGPVTSVVPYLEQPCVVTLPIDAGGGTRLKILEAFAARRPVVSTSKGAEGIEAVDGDHLLIRNDVESMAQAVVDLWRYASMRERICEQALALVRAQYSWSSAGQRIVESLGMTSVAGRRLTARPTANPGNALSAPAADRS
jgi:glycosyltransferase involved in cell wall biosynthesis